ncbi:MAG: hypothetical protein ACJ751_14920 [Niastella sp.]|uniref:hypothetical protein n=1 Tax=Niastella sp. TaxID=1869183 RepID=UPI00389A0009
MVYPNNDFSAYVDVVCKQYNFKLTDNFFVKLLKILPVLIWRTIKDACIELFFLFAFWMVLAKMSQGRDLIVSLFEPEGIYGKTRIVFTTLAVLSLSVSMWIIPAFMFHERELRTKEEQRPNYPLHDHLFFMHRVLPLVPFWLLAAVLFNDHSILFLLAGLLQLVLLFYYNRWIINQRTRNKILMFVGAIWTLIAVWFFAIFHQEYTQAKVLLAINLYVLSVFVYLVYHQADNRILRVHASGVVPGESLITKYKLNSIIYFSCLLAHTLIVLLIYYLPFRLSFAPESLMLYMFSVYVFAIDLFLYIINVSKRRQLAAALVGMGVVIVMGVFHWHLNTSHYTMDPNANGTLFVNSQRDDFSARYEALKKNIEANRSGEPYPVILVSGEGGGSRAGLWLSQNLINFDYDTKGAFRNHIFSMSTVSGSSVGLGTVFTFWDNTRDATNIDSSWLELPATIYANNYVGSSIRGLLLTDLYKSLVPGNWKKDRNSTLQNEEAKATARAVLKAKGYKDWDDCDIDDSGMTLKKDFMYFFYEQKDNGMQYRKHTPIVLINTCRSNDGRRGIFSSIKLGETYFNEAIDVAGYLYEDSVCDDNGVRRCKGIKMPISLGQACNTSELFPLFSAPAYVNGLGSFVDGGYHENSGLKSTLDIYQQLKIKLDKEPPNGKYKIYIMYLKNGSGEKELYKKMESEPVLLQPLHALFSQPFEGSASYFEEKARYVGAVDENVVFLPIKLNPKNLVNANLAGVTDNHKKRLESEILKDLINDIVVNSNGTKDTILNFPLARWLSKTVINRMQMCASPAHRNVEVNQLLEQVKRVNSVSAPTNEPFMKYPVHQELKMPEDTVGRNKIRKAFLNY